jgi:uncharacterized membrane protein YhaH (DUF805 family)
MRGAIMNFVEALTSGFRNYVDFSGRAVRPEYWYWMLFAVVVNAVLGVVDQNLNPGDQMGAFSWVTMIVFLGLALPTLAVSCRRLHDIDRTGLWLLAGLTGIGVILLLYWASLPGTAGANSFGK